MCLKKGQNMGQIEIEMHLKRTKYCMNCRRREVKDVVKCGRRKDQIWTEMQVNKIVDGAGKAAGCPTQSWETLARDDGGKMRNEEDEGGGMRLKVVKL